MSAESACVAGVAARGCSCSSAASRIASLHSSACTADSQCGSGNEWLFLELHAAGNTLILVTHEPAIAAQCPRAIRMSDGRIVSDGAGLHVAAELTLGSAVAT